MKKIILAAVAFLITASFYKSSAQDSTQQYQLSQLLSQYYNIKDALVAGKSNLASAKAEEFIKVANTIDYKVISEGNINALLKDATPISESKDIKTQREHFANLSNNMTTLAKAMKLTNQSIYQAYCPMKKANWLSSDKEIKNPYYGSAMLTCGKVVETINQ
jgi:hypothetical protein